MGTFVFHLDPVSSMACPFCEKEVEETFFYAFLDCPPATVILHFPQHPLWHSGLGLLQDCVHLLYPLPRAKGCEICLANFMLGQAKTATLKSHRNWLGGAGSNDALQLFCFQVQACIRFEFGNFTLQENVDQFVLCWVITSAK